MRSRKATRESLIEMFKPAVKYGEEFPLSAGGMSNFFIDASKVILSAFGVYNIAGLIWDHHFELDAWVGVMSGADPIIGALLYMDAQIECNTKGGLIRKEPKNDIEGCDLAKEDQVVIIDDVVTTGKQVLRACDIVEATGAKVLAVVSVVDRGGRENITKRGYDYFPLLTLEDLGICVA